MNAPLVKEMTPKQVERATQRADAKIAKLIAKAESTSAKLAEKAAKKEEKLAEKAAKKEEKLAEKAKEKEEKLAEKAKEKEEKLAEKVAEKAKKMKEKKEASSNDFDSVLLSVGRMLIKEEKCNAKLRRKEAAAQKKKHIEMRDARRRLDAIEAAGMMFRRASRRAKKNNC